MSTHWKAVLGVLLIFVFGCISGWLGASVVHYRQTMQMLRGGPEAVTELFERRMTRNLALDENQRQRIHQCFMENAQQRKELQKQIQPQVQMLNRETYQQILAVLDPDQAEKFRHNIALFRQRFGKSAFNPLAENQPPPVPSPAGASTNANGGTPPQ